MIVVISEEELLDLVLHFLNLGLEATTGVSKDGAGNDVSADTACASEIGLLGDVNVWDVLQS